MPDLSWIDWSATLAFLMIAPFAVGVSLCGIPPVRRSMVKMLADHELQGAVAAFALIASVQVLFFIAEHNESGWFGQEVAAWLQALGSLAALAIVIWVDGRAAQRLKEDRKGEWEKQRQARAQESEDRRRARIDAIRESHDALESAAHSIERMPLKAPGVSLSLPPPVIVRLRAASDAIDYYLAQPVDLEMRTLAALTRTKHRLEQARSQLGGKWFAHAEPDNQRQLTAVFRAAAEEIKRYLASEEAEGGAPV